MEQTPGADSDERLARDLYLVRNALQTTQDFARDIEVTEIEEVMGIALLALKRIERRLEVQR
jgi:hypothetical protein